MSRSGDDRADGRPAGGRSGVRAGARLAAAAIALGPAIALLLTPGPVSAAEATSHRQLGGIDLNTATELALVQLQEQWLQWIGAFYQGDSARSERVVDELLATAGQLGMNRLPDLSLGALTQAEMAARGGDFDRARWALAAAERLDPGRPEIAFAAAAVHRSEGRWAAAVGDAARGWARVAAQPAERRLWLHGLGRYALYLLLVSALLFVALEMAIHGAGPLRDLVHRTRKSLPPPLATVLAVVVLGWPLVLPQGVVWLGIYWSLLLWSYVSVSERAVLVALWLLLGAAPIALAEQRLRVEVVQSPPVRAIESLVEGRLYGSVFTDLGVLQSLAPNAPAVLQFLGDLQRRLGDWDLALAHYRRVREAEPDNNPVLLDIGAYYFFKRDYGTAIRYFQQATASMPENAAAFFDLSQAFSESYHFDESRRALDQAQRLDNAKVSEWIRDSASQRLQIFDRGFERAPEIVGALLAERRSAGLAPARLSVVRHGETLLTVVAFALAAVALAHWRRPSSPGADGASGGPGPGPWPRALVPGLSSMTIGEGVRAWAALALPVALALLPLAHRLGLRLPLGIDPGAAIPWALAVAGLALLFGTRIWIELREAG